MRRAFPILFTLAALFVSGCNMWPPAGTGGWAEFDGYNSAPEIEAAAARLDAARAGPNGKHRPAAVFAAELALVRVERAHAAGLHQAFEGDMAELQARLEELE